MERPVPDHGSCFARVELDIVSVVPRRDNNVYRDLRPVRGGVADCLALEITDLANPLTLLQLKSQYHTLSLLLHPDKNPTEKQKFTELFQNLHNS